MALLMLKQSGGPNARGLTWWKQIFFLQNFSLVVSTHLPRFLLLLNEYSFKSNPVSRCICFDSGRISVPNSSANTGQELPLSSALRVTGNYQRLEVCLPVSAGWMSPLEKTNTTIIPVELGHKSSSSTQWFHESRNQTLQIIRLTQLFLLLYWI